MSDAGSVPSTAHLRRLQNGWILYAGRDHVPGKGVRRGVILLSEAELNDLRALLHREASEPSPHEPHPAEVTARQLLSHYQRWHDRLSPDERISIMTVRIALQRIAEEDGATALREER